MMHTLCPFIFTGTCRSGYKRHSESTKCKKCPDSVANKIMLGVGFVVMVASSSFLVYVTIKGNERKTGKGKLSAIVSTILL